MPLPTVEVRCDFGNLWGPLDPLPPPRGQQILAPSVSIPLVDAYRHQPRVGVKPEGMFFVRAAKLQSALHAAGCPAVAGS